MDIDIKGVCRAKLLAALHNNTRPQGMGVLRDLGRNMTEQEAQSILDAYPTGFDVVWFDYVHGRPVKVGFKGDVLVRADLYDRDAPGGAGSAERIVNSLR
jgi:hypothetical protein